MKSKWTSKNMIGNGELDLSANIIFYYRLKTQHT
jgi:hypothetical protein